MKAHVTIQNFGSDEDKRGICDTLNHLTFFHFYIGDQGCVRTSCKLTEIGDLLILLAMTEETNWIEYTVQFDC